ncbi:MAG: SDR family oxidoreductase [Cellulosilyticaceae bacterium]
MLITGAHGFLASRFIDYYKNIFQITALARYDLCLTDEAAVNDYFSTHSYDFVFHCAAIADTGMCENNPELAYQVNTEATRYIAQGCAAQGATLIFASSEQVYNGNHEDGPYTEDTVPNPNTVYAHTKLEAEQHIQSRLANHYILRLPWLFGFPERFKKTNPNILMNTQKALCFNTPLALAANEYRSMTYIYDLIDNLGKLLELPYGIYNFGSENNDASTYEIGQFICEVMGAGERAADLLIKDVDRYKDHPRDLRITNTKLQRYGIHFPTTKEGLIKCLTEFK